MASYEESRKETAAEKSETKTAKGIVNLWQKNHSEDYDSPRNWPAIIQNSKTHSLRHYCHTSPLAIIMGHFIVHTVLPRKVPFKTSILLYQKFMNNVLTDEGR